MTGEAPATRRYEVVVNAGEVRIQRFGPANVLQMAQGRSVLDAPRLAALLHPVCPTAHAAAALDAIESAARIELDETQRAARELLAIGEAVSGCVWRAALSLARLVEVEANVEAVRRARAAAEGLAGAVYSCDWRSLGGAAVRPNMSAVDNLVGELEGSAAAVATTAERVTAACVDDAFAGASQIARLGEGVFDPSIEPAGGAREETPRSFMFAEPEARLAAWFEGQAAYAEFLVGRLRELAAALRVSAPDRLPPEVSGSGVGVVLTARGRLRHAISIEAGRIEAWAASAPTDWNFAPGGLAEKGAAELYGAGAARNRYDWLLAAMDPCAPVSLRLGSGGDA
ncbi:MAG: nickel-dependent hydrogenase large subunit [Pseudomonadota bacterium]